MNPFKLKRRHAPLLLGMLALAFSFWLSWTDQAMVRNLFSRLENLVYDIRLQTGLSFQSEAFPGIVIVDIDEKSLNEEGRWPWSRQKIKNLTDALFKEKAALVGFDVVFSEAEANVAHLFLQKLPQKIPMPPFMLQALWSLKDQFDWDKRLGEFLLGKEVVLGFFLHQSAEEIGVLPKSYSREIGEAPKIIPVMNGFTGNLPSIQQATESAGFLTNFRDQDGLLRRSPLVLVHEGVIYPALALEMARRYLLEPYFEIKLEKMGEGLVIDHIKLGSRKIETDSKGQVLVPFRGKPRSFTTVSASDVLKGKVPRAFLENALVLVGTSALGLGDLVPTPVSSAFPGVEVHASILAGILENSFFTEPAWHQGAEWAFMLVIGLFLVIVLPKLGPFFMLLLGAGLFVFCVLLNFWIWVEYHFSYDLSLQLICVLNVLLLNLAYGFFVENKRKQEIKSIFGQYVPRDHIEEMANEDNPQFGFEGETRDMSVLFADIRDFTTISESLSATELKKCLNDFLTPMTEIIFQHKGTIDKYVGDMVMAFWGAPLRVSTHANLATRAALAMLAEAEKISAFFKTRGLPAIQIGIGVNTGLMNVGDMGSQFRRSYTVLGDTVNLASRLESLTKYYGVSLLLGENTVKDQTEFLFQRIDKVRVKGKSESVTLYTVLGLKSEVDQAQQDEANRYEEALAAYLAADFVRAKSLFEALKKQFGDRRLYSLMLARIEEFAQHPPAPSWDGVYKMIEK